jgi:hypothetical protein
VHVIEAKRPSRCSTCCKAYVHPSLHIAYDFIMADGSLCSGSFYAARTGKDVRPRSASSSLLLADSGFWSPSMSLGTWFRARSIVEHHAQNERGGDKGDPQSCQKTCCVGRS